MGDRTACWLVMQGEIAPEQVETLQEAFREARCEDPLDSLAKTGGMEKEWPLFLDVNYGECPDEIAAAMRALALDYAWLWDHGSDYPGGARLFVHEAGECTEIEAGYVPSDRQVTIPVDSLDNTLAVENAKRVQSFLDEARLTVKGIEPLPDDDSEARSFYVKVRYYERNLCEGTVQVKAASAETARKVVEDAYGDFTDNTGCGEFQFGREVDGSGPLGETVEVQSVSEDEAEGRAWS